MGVRVALLCLETSQLTLHVLVLASLPSTSVARTLVVYANNYVCTALASKGMYDDVLNAMTHEVFTTLT